MELRQYCFWEPIPIPKSIQKKVMNKNNKKTDNTCKTFLIIRMETPKLIRQTKKNHEKEELLNIKIKKDSKNNTTDFYKTFITKLTGY